MQPDMAVVVERFARDRLAGCFSTASCPNSPAWQTRAAETAGNYRPPLASDANGPKVAGVTHTRQAASRLRAGPGAWRSLRAASCNEALAHHGGHVWIKLHVGHLQHQRYRHPRDAVDAAQRTLRRRRTRGAVHPQHLQLPRLPPRPCPRQEVSTAARATAEAQGAVQPRTLICVVSSSTEQPAYGEHARTAEGGVAEHC
jgi:hypothetical protein